MFADDGVLDCSFSLSCFGWVVVVVVVVAAAVVAVVAVVVAVA